jgi:PKD repeat protein
MRTPALTRWIATGALAVTAIAAGCTMKSQDAPPLTGPSELGTSITVTVSPDILTQDGSSQSLVTILARDSKGNALRNLSLRAEIEVGGVRADFGSLSQRNLVTDSNGQAKLVYTSPAAPAGPAVDTGTTVNIVVTPIGTEFGDFGNSTARLATIRLVPSGVVIPADGLQPKFTVTPPSPTDHQSVFFDATSSTAPSNNPIASYSWDFGDGRTGSGATTTHSYNTSGTYVAKLTISDAYGRSASTTQAVNVGQGSDPSAAFTFSPSAPQVNQVVNFNASASKPATGRTIVSYFWDFGDGTQKTSTSSTTTHDFVAAGSYQVTLTLTDDAGHTGSVTIAVPVGITAAPTASFLTSPSLPRAGDVVNFNASASQAATGHTIRTYAWDFGDGSPQTTTKPQTTHAYLNPGTYTVTLVVTDDVGATGVKSNPVTVASDAPIADFSFTQSAPTSTHTMVFNSSGSSAAPGRTITSYAWDFGDSLPGSSLASPTHAYTAAGSYNVTLTVTDSAGKTGRVTKTVAVQ